MKFDSFNGCSSSCINNRDVKKSWGEKLCIKSVKSGKDGTGTPCLVTWGWNFTKQGKRVHWASRGHETQFSSKLDAKLSLPCPFFYWAPSINHCSAMCTVAINVLEPRAFNAESQHFIPLFNKISWLCGQPPGGDEASNEGCNSGPIGHDFTDNFNVEGKNWRMMEEEKKRKTTKAPDLRNIVCCQPKYEAQTSCMWNSYCLWNLQPYAPLQRVSMSVWETQS